MKQAAAFPNSTPNWADISKCVKKKKKNKNQQFPPSLFCCLDSALSDDILVSQRSQSNKFLLESQHSIYDIKLDFDTVNWKLDEHS